MAVCGYCVQSAAAFLGECDNEYWLRTGRR